MEKKKLPIFAVGYIGAERSKVRQSFLCPFVSLLFMSAKLMRKFGFVKYYLTI